MHTQLAVLAGLSAIMLVVFARALRPAPRPRAVPQPLAAAAPAPPTREGPRDAQRLWAAALRWERDPFARAGANESLGGLSLSGILFDAERPLAIINGTMVEVGQELDGFRVVAITTDRVLLSDGTEQYQLQVSP